MTASSPRFPSAILAIGILLAAMQTSFPVAAAEFTDSLQVDPSTPHQFTFTNKVAAFWYGEIQQAHQNSFQGYTILEQRYLSDYQWQVTDQPVSRSEAASIILWPDRLLRKYPAFSETFWFVDSLDALIWEISTPRLLNLSFLPRWDASIEPQGWEWSDSLAAATGEFENVPAGKPSLVLIKAFGQLQSLQPEWEKSDRNGKDAPQVLKALRLENAEHAYLLVLFGSDATRMAAMAKEVENHPDSFLRRRSNRIQKLFQRSRIRTPDQDINRAYFWARIAMDGLITHQGAPGIWAGLPWFNNYWGRDSFISFSGALLCSGQFKLARRILRSFSDFQMKDNLSHYYGRIPNRVTLHDTIYNTADGVPYFVKACENYVAYSGDTAFVAEIFPVLETAFRGAAKNYVDEYGFLTHGDAETWMDAVGSEGPWSPRGNRAVEIQALWAEQLRITRDWAKRLSQLELVRETQLLLDRFYSNFLRYFWDEGNHRLIDHLNGNNTPDRQVRPNAIFALVLPRKSLLEKSQMESVLAEIVNRLTYRWGVSTLSQDDPNFHPYHHFSPYYVPDAAYHNGLVWTWLNGPVLSALFPRRPDLAMQLMREEAFQILHLDALGSFSELLEAWPRPGQSYPNVSGTVSQAWSLAEFIRNVHEDLAGIQPEVARGQLSLAPNFPEKWEFLRFTIPVGESIVTGEYRRSAGKLSVALQPVPAAEQMTVVFNLPFQGHRITGRLNWNTADALNLNVYPQGTGLRAEANEKLLPVVQSLPVEVQPHLKFCEPTMATELPVFKKPEYPLIPAEEAVKRPGRFSRVLFDIRDPEGDDRGPNGQYTYPTNPHFVKGIFDGRRVRIKRDSKYYYFEIEYEALVNPGWKPESGYQLTYTAITLNFGDKVGFRRTKVEMNANYSVPPEYAYNVVIYLGNGFRVVNAAGEVIAAYRPEDTKYPLANVKDKKIRFAVPRRLLPDADLKNVAVLIGGQDDHGGGGLGEFRSVGRKASEWQGGGGEKDSDNPNVYDVILIRR